MSTTPLYYEQPLNERMRSFLRLEHLFMQADAHVAATSPWNARSALAAIVEILNLLGRVDLRLETLKELERHLANLNRLAETPTVNREALQTVLLELEDATRELQSTQGKLAQPLYEHEFLATIRQRMSIPGGTCCFDSPAFHHWLAQSREIRQGYLTSWLDEFLPLRHGVDLVLALLRKSAIVKQETAVGGAFQQSLEGQAVCQLIRIALPKSVKVYPEVSASKHRVNIRFLSAHFNGERPAQTSRNVSFGLSCCAL